MKKPISSKLHGLLDHATALAARREVPFRTHGTIDKALGVVLPALPWVIGFARHRRARNFFLALAAVSIVVMVLTDGDEEQEQGAF